MITGKEDLLQAMIEAYVMEKGTNEFYKEASHKAINKVAKDAFGVLAEWEHEHMLYIQFLYQAILESREEVSFDEFKKSVMPTFVEGAIPIKEIQKKMESYEFIDDLGALTIALEIEGKAYNLYRRLSEQAPDTNTKAFMKDMMNWELKHIDYLKELRYKLPETS
jgi:rubrerythrin